MVEYSAILIGYLLGSVSSAVVVARALHLQDPREVGSGNPGATNVLRYGGKGAAIATLLGDLLKGVVAVLIARELSAQPSVIAATMIAVFLGHLFPVFFGFKGGKGVATALGAYLGASPWVGGALAITWVVVAVVSRYSSLSALVATALSPLYVWYWLGDPAYVVGSILMSAILFWRHRGNVKRLLDGSESKIGK
ncbi:MAG: acyl-phosphate glycerol 3-phosphate acyltransferase [Thiotrichales bacterium SG8_50]|jgi:glycerol-3-phosphate acyltransferase PlsY|nr:MAG: acyl-phosphate glycerol 3-phosphate acyltransferase [Thiotrichales bacterium SG8_50]